MYVIDVTALSETFLSKKLNFRISGYDTIRNDHSTGQGGGGVAFLVKHGLVVNKEYKNSDFNIITDYEALAINLELSNNQNLTLATICRPNGNKVMFVGDFSLKLQSFGCAKKNVSGPMLQNVQKQLNLIYLNNEEHTHMDKSKGSTDLLDMAFISPNPAKHAIQSQIGDDLGSNHLPIEVSIGAPPHRNSSINHTKYKFDLTDRSIRINTRGSDRFRGLFWTYVNW